MQATIHGVTKSRARLRDFTWSTELETAPLYIFAVGVCWHEASLVAQTVKNLPAIWEALVRSLGWEDPLEEGMATHSSTLA